MNHETNENSPKTNVEAAPGLAKNSQRVRSSRYEWEKRPEDQKKEVTAKGAGQSWMTALRSWLRRFVATQNRFFDNDDDRTASAI